jgi:hypothetical protein
MENLQKARDLAKVKTRTKSHRSFFVFMKSDQGAECGKKYELEGDRGRFLSLGFKNPSQADF